MHYLINLRLQAKCRDSFEAYLIGCQRGVSDFRGHMHKMTSHNHKVKTTEFLFWHYVIKCIVPPLQCA